MGEYQFFKYTPLFKEFMLLDFIEKDSNITQRALSNIIGSSVSMINTYIEENEKKGYLERVYKSNKNLEYKITKKGIERKRLLNIEYLKSSHSIYLSAKDNIIKFINQIIDKGYKNIFLYGAGEVAEILLSVLDDNKAIPIEILGVIDEDMNKQGKTIFDIPINNIDILDEVDFDGILISSYIHKEKIYNKLVLKGIIKERIFTFFDIE